jgi:mRNA-degrading endonuclease toxin of MazEF toxin-antitoxin module
MPLSRGLVVYYKFPHAPDKEHPAIVISNIEVEKKDQFLIIVMISNTTTRDLYTYDLDCNMFKLSQNAPTGQVRMHCIMTVKSTDVRIPDPLVYMTKANVDSLVEQISTTTLGG